MNQESLDRALKEAISQATSSADPDDDYWRAVVALRASGATTSTLASLSGSPDGRLRALAVDVLRVPPSEEERARTLSHLRLLLQREDDSHVLASLAAAFNELAPPDLVDLVLPLATSTDADLRHAVAVALGGSRDARAITAMILLSSDPDETVRNWAVFGLGSQLGEPERELFDTDEIRSALAMRLVDPHEETRAEATLGLAMRGDLRAIPIIRQELGGRTSWCHYVEASYYLASDELCPALREFSDGLSAEDRAFWEKRPRFPLSSAIKACCEKGGKPVERGEVHGTKHDPSRGNE